MSEAFASRICRAVPVVAALWATTAFAESIAVTTDKPDGVYPVGGVVHWTVKIDGKLDGVTYAVMPGEGKATASGPVDDKPVDYAFAAPGTVLLKVTGKAADGKTVTGVGGAVAGADQIQPSAARPDDFDAFWAAKIKELRDIPANPQLTPADAGKPNVTYTKITLDNINGTHVRGQIARPAKGEKFPALLRVQYAGVYPLQKDWVTGPASGGWLTLNILAHDLPIDEQPAFYKAQGDGPLKNYPFIGNDDRETSYFLRMYLSCVRAVDYLKTRPDWDGHTLVVVGGSQGGLQSLMTAGLCPDDVTAAMADVPAGCDMLGPDVGRKGGWPQWYDATRGPDWHTPHDANKVHEASRYFDVVNFTPHVRCPVLVATGLVDEVCPPAGVIAAFNQIPGHDKKLLLMPGAAHQSVNKSHDPFDKRAWHVWAPALLHGQPAPLDQ